MNLTEIKANLNERITNYTSQNQLLEDEIRIAWLICEVDRLNELLDDSNPGWSADIAKEKTTWFINENARF